MNNQEIKEFYILVDGMSETCQNDLKFLKEFSKNLNLLEHAGSKEKFIQNSAITARRGPTASRDGAATRSRFHCLIKSLRVVPSRLSNLLAGQCRGPTFSRGGSAALATSFAWDGCDRLQTLLAGWRCDPASVRVGRLSSQTTASELAEKWKIAERP